MALIPSKSNHYLEWGPWAIGRPLQAESGEEERYGPALRDRDVEGAVRRAPHPVGVAGAKDSPVLPVVSSVAAWEIMSRDEFACTNKKYSNNQTKQGKIGRLVAHWFHFLEFKSPWKMLLNRWNTTINWSVSNFMLSLIRFVNFRGFHSCITLNIVKIYWISLEFHLKCAN